MHNKVLATLAYEVSYRVGDTSASFIAKVKDFLNDRYDDVMLRSAATIWTNASTARLGDTDIPTLGLGEVIKEGAIADAWDAKRQFAKSTKFEAKFEFKLANFIISEPFTRFNISIGRYDYHEI
jgi:hypothetical protein